MNQAKEYLALAIKFHFWIVCVVVVLLGFGSWRIATGTLDAQTNDNVSKIKSAESTINTIRQINPHPNEEFAKGMDAVMTRVKYSLANGWRKRYQQQAAVLKWPTSFPEEFVAQVDKLRPIEKFDGKEIPDNYLELYRNFAGNELPRLSKIVGAHWYRNKPGAGPGGGPGPGGPPGSFRPPSEAGGPGGIALKGDDSIVRWPEENQKKLVEEHFKFIDLNGNPTGLQVLYAQEDLWVLEALLRIIRETNGNVDANYDAAIKVIESVQMGKSAQGRHGKISQIAQTEGRAEGGPGMPPGYPGGPTASPVTAAPGMPAAGPVTPPSAADQANPAFGRYVDVNYNALPPSQLVEALKPTAPPELAIYGVAKRIPVRLRLIMDQRRLNALLANCGNSKLPIEVRQVRINCAPNLLSDDNFFGGGGGGSGGYSRGGPSEGGYPSGGPGSSKDVYDENVLPVEVYGIVYIFNPEDQSRLGVQLDESGGVPAPAAPGAPAIPAPNVPAVPPPMAVVPGGGNARR